MIIEKKIKIINPSGLHARPASLFVQVANKYDSEISVKKGKQKVNGKSIMGIMMLAAECGSKIVIVADGPDARDAIKELADILLSEKIEVDNEENEK